MKTDYRLGIDAGGTFTDFVLADQTGQVRLFKALSTPQDPTLAIKNGLALMTEELGVSATEAEEFEEIYKLEVLVIPSHRPIARDDMPDFVYRSAEAKWRAVFDRRIMAAAYFGDLLRRPKLLAAAIAGCELFPGLAPALMRKAYARVAAL